MFNENNPGPTSHAFKQKVLLNNTDHSNDVQNFKYKNMEQIYIYFLFINHFLKLSATKTLKSLTWNKFIYFIYLSIIF